MPRIDPERLLRCLQPLLDTSTGAIRSCEEVDKILGLMSKFSKKLVSKCIYINILKTTHPSVLDQFMERGGWALIFGWTNDGVNSRNYPLLREVLELLLITPTTVPRLKENRFPLLVKSLSKDCEILEIKNLAKQVVSRWITIAKAEEEACKAEGQQIQQSTEVSMGGTGILPTVPDLIQGGVPADLGQLAMNTSDSLLNIDPSLIPDAEMDLDLSHTDFANIDLNLDILSKVVDQHNLDENLGEAVPTSSAHINNPMVQGVQQQQHQLILSEPSNANTNMVLTNTNVLAHPSVTVPNVPAVSTEQIPIQPQQQSEEVYRMIQVQPAPKIFIKTVGGQRTVVQNLSSDTGSIFMVIKDGKHVLMKVKEPSPQVVAPIVIQQQAATAEAPITKSQDMPDSSKEIHRSKPPKKDGHLSKTKNSGEAIKTYGSSKAKLPEKEEIKKSVDQNIKQSHNKPEKHKDKDKKKTSKDKSSNDKKSKSSSINTKTNQAALAAKQQAEEEKLREEIRKQKALVKKRAKEAEKQKQQEKDQETLKKLNLGPPSSASASNSSLKIPKIPRKPTSFADAIGIPGADSSSSADKIKKVSSDKDKEKTVSKSTKEDSPTPSSPTKKFYGRVEEPEGSESEKPKERRNKPKVFVSSKSRSDDLLKEMTESTKSKSAKEKEKEKEEPKSSNTTGYSILATPKMTKRLSTDSVEKPGDAKKAKLSESSSKSDKDKAKEKDAKEASKEKEKKKPITLLKESTLFMDMLNASSETTKPTKRKRRPSTGSGNEKEIKELVSPSENKSLKVSIDEDESGVQEVNTTPDEPVKKPVFNFYRDTLNDSIEDDKTEDDSKTEPEKDEKEPMDQNNESGSFTPQEGDGKIKSALCLVRPRNRPRKTVRWREDDELREFHFFEMDETERVNVTKQREFTELSQHERLHERYNMRRKAEEEESEAAPWKMQKIEFVGAIIQPPIISEEKAIQEEREANVLGLFLPPGAALPDTAIEPDPVDAVVSVDRSEPRVIPVEDVNVITKVMDFRTHPWPPPKSLMGVGAAGGYGATSETDKKVVNHPVNNFPPGNDYNPWNASLGFNVPPPTGVPNMGSMGDVTFPHFSIPPPGVMNMPLNMLNAVQPPPVSGLGFGTPNPFAFPPMVPPVTAPPVDSFGSSFNHDGRIGMPSRGGGRFNDTDQRRNFHGRDNRDSNNRDRGGSNRDRDYRDERGHPTGRGDRDYRRRERENNDRDFRQYDRDRNSRDFRGNNRNVRKDIPCKFYKKGHCHLGNRCEFLHDGPSNNDDTRNMNSRQDSFDPGRSRKSPDSKDFDMRQSATFDGEDWEAETSSDPIPAISEMNATRFAQPPSSPPAGPASPEIPQLSSNTESTKVIPV